MTVQNKIFLTFWLLQTTSCAHSSQTTSPQSPRVVAACIPTPDSALSTAHAQELCKLTQTCNQFNKQLHFPSFRLCTDNAGMIAFVGHFKAQQEQYSDLSLKVF